MSTRRILSVSAIIVLTTLSIAFLVLLPRLPGIAAGMGAKPSSVEQLRGIVDRLCGIGLCSVEVSMSPSRLPMVSRGFMLASAILLSGASMAAYYYLRDRVVYYEKLRRQVTELLPIATSLTQARTTTLEILRIASSMMEDPLRTMLRNLVQLISLGEDPEAAARKVAAGAPVEVRAVLDSIAVGAKSGGRFAEVLERANEYFLEVFRMEK
jgi:Flp pilus assembly protein TadB